MHVSRDDKYQHCQDGGMTHTTSKPVILDFLEAKTPTQSQTIANATQTKKGKSLDLLMIPDVQ